MTHAERIRHDLAEQILNGARVPGASLDEMTLAQEYGASRTPVREALRQLAASGLVAYTRHKGVEVAAPTPDELAEMFVVMADLEGLCAGHCAVMMSTEQRRDLELFYASMAPLVQEGDLAGYRDANDEFHSRIYTGSKNRYLADLTRKTRLRLQPFRRAQFQSLGRLGESHAEHGEIVTAILRADRASAIAAMTRHILDVRDAYQRLARAADYLK
jgi:DNA-binding GntR family transcriptional regulator